MIKTIEKNGNFRYLVDTRKSAKGVSHGDRKVFKTLDEAKTYEKMKNKEFVKSQLNCFKNPITNVAIVDEKGNILEVYENLEK